MYIGLHVKCPLFLSDCNETLIFPTDFRKIFIYQISWKSVQWERSCSVRTDRHTYLTELIVALRSFANAPKNSTFYPHSVFVCFVLMLECTAFVSLYKHNWYVFLTDAECWIKIDQFDVTCFIISLFTAQHVSNFSTSIFRSLRLIVDLFLVLYCSGSMCVGVTVWFGWGGVVSFYRLKLCYYFTIYCSTCFEC